MKPIRMQVTALGGRIMAGHTNKAGTQLTEGSRQDVTSDFMKCLLQKAEHHGAGFEILGDGKRWDVTVKELSAMAAKEAGPEHVCSGCGAKGWTGNCLECIPY